MLLFYSAFTACPQALKSRTTSAVEADSALVVCTAVLIQFFALIGLSGALLLTGKWTIGLDDC